MNIFYKIRKFPTNALTSTLVVISFLLSPVTAEDAHATPGVHGYYWQLIFDFDSGIDAILKVDVGHGETGSLTEILATRNFQVPCDAAGVVTVAGGAATFDGASYLKCELHLQRAINQVIDTCREIDPDCLLTVHEEEIYGSIKMGAAMSQVAPGIAPIFYHPDAAFTMIANTFSGVQLQSTLTTTGGQIQPTSTPLSISHINDMQMYTARFVCVDPAMPSCNMTFGATGQTEVVNTPNHPSQFTTTPSTIFVGYNPVTGQTIPLSRIDHLNR